MTSRDFVYWLQGFFELSDVTPDSFVIDQSLTTTQIKAIKRHLAMVFAHEIDPGFGDSKKQELLTKIHQGSMSVPSTSGYVQGPLPPATSIDDVKIRC